MVTVLAKHEFSLLASLLMLLSTAAAATEWARGHVNMQGSIVDTACTIATGDRVQAIEMSTVPIGTLVREGRGPDNKFDIMLSGCILAQAGEGASNQKRFSITFNGDSAGDDFQITGQAKGIALRITDINNNIAKPGIALLPKEITPEAMTLNFHLFLVGDRQIIQAGDYSAVVKFNMSYY